MSAYRALFIARDAVELSIVETILDEEGFSFFAEDVERGAMMDLYTMGSGAGSMVRVLEEEYDEAVEALCRLFPKERIEV